MYYLVNNSKKRRCTSKLSSYSSLELQIQVKELTGEVVAIKSLLTQLVDILSTSTPVIEPPIPPVDDLPDDDDSNDNNDDSDPVIDINIDDLENMYLAINQWLLSK